MSGTALLYTPWEILVKEIPILELRKDIYNLQVGRILNG